MKKDYRKIRVQDMKRIPIRVSPELLDDISARAEMEGKKKCRMIEQILEEGMNQYFEKKGN